jgi:uncharacterized protein YdaU (DUF1376 family)
MSALPYMPLYVADYLADAAHLSTEEHGAYMLLIMNYWQRGKPLPADPERLARIARMSNERWTDVERTLNEFFEVVGGEWRHKRIDAELAKVFAKSQKAKQAGRASARSKTNKSSTDVQHPSNERSTSVERTLNHTDTDTDTDSTIANAIVPRAKRSRSRGEMLPSDFTASSDMIAFGQKLGLTEPDISYQLDKMRDWATSRGETKKDWTATFRNWLRETADRKKSQQSPRIIHGKQPIKSIAELAAQDLGALERGGV